MIETLLFLFSIQNSTECVAYVVVFQRNSLIFLSLSVTVYIESILLFRCQEVVYCE